MTIQEILEVTEGKILTQNVDIKADATSAFSADLMSDVLHLAKEGALLLTGLTHPQVVRTAEMAEIAAILFVRDKIPPPETIQLAEEKGVPLLATKYTMFETSGRIYSAGMDSCDAPRTHCSH
jgi:predicted transcriptional regulator